MQPLAHRLRPKTIADVVGQEHIIGPGKLINQLIDQQSMFSLIFFGPPGVGKTTVAQILADALHMPYTFFNAATDHKAQLTGIIATAKISKNYILIIDEIHRLKKDNQDVLLPYLEDGTCYIIGLTTANPYFSVNPAIRSRCHILEFKPLSEEAITAKLASVVNSSEQYFKKKIEASNDILRKITQIAGGDLRTALNVLELATYTATNIIDEQVLQNLYSQTNYLIDRDGDGHYDTLSAFQKSIRGSDVNAALHYLARLIIAGDLESICRRLAVIAFEDIGLANPMACVHTMAAIDCARQVGLPEARLPLSNAVIELALSPKSRSGHDAINAAINDIEKGLIDDIPEFIKFKPLNPPIQYSADDPNKYKYEYLPEKLRTREYYHPKESKQSYETTLYKNAQILKQIRKEFKGQK